MWRALIALAVVCAAALPAQGQSMTGVVRATVVGASDPIHMQRLLVRIPSLGGGARWALPCVPYSADGLELPPPGATVWVAFEDGDENRPVWLGWLPDAPARKDGKLHMRLPPRPEPY